MSTKRSEHINELALALSLAQAQISSARKDSENPHLRIGYSSLDSVWNACRKPLSDNGLAVVQIPSNNENGRLMLETILIHSSGQWISTGELEVPQFSQKGINELQAMGGAITYVRRYALGALVGVTTKEEDNDGNNDPHWSEISRNVKTISESLKSEGIQIETLFEACKARSWSEMVTFSGSGQDALRKARSLHKTREEKHWSSVPENRIGLLQLISEKDIPVSSLFEACKVTSWAEMVTFSGSGQDAYNATLANWKPPAPQDNTSTAEEWRREEADADSPQSHDFVTSAKEWAEEVTDTSAPQPNNPNAS